MRKKLTLLLAGVFVALALSGPVVAAQQIQTAYGPKPIFKDTFNVEAAKSGSLALIISLSEKPAAGETINLTAAMTGKLSGHFTLPSSTTFTGNDTNYTNIGSLYVNYDGKAAAGDKAKITLAGSSLSKELNFTATSGAGDFTVGNTISGSSGSGGSSGTTTGTTSTSPTVVGTNSGAPGFVCPTGKSGQSQIGCPLAELLVDKDGFVYQSWRITRGAINTLLIIALLAISFSNILKINIDTYTVKKALPNLVIGVILANVSFLIVRYMVDINTVATYFFVNLAQPYTGADTFHGFLTAAAELVGTNTIASTLNALGPIIVLVLAIVSIVVLLWLAFLLYFRLVAIYLLTILAPLAFIAYGVPGFEKYFKQWWQQFVKWVFMLPAMSALFWLMIVIAHTSISNGSIAGLMIMYLLLVTALSLPSKMGGAVIDRASKAFQKYTGVNAARKYGTDQFNAGKERAGLRFQQGFGRTGVGKMLADYKAKRELDTANIKKDISQLGQRATSRVRDGRAGYNEATLEREGSILGNVESRVKAKQAEAALTTDIASRLNATDLQKTTAEKFKERKEIEERIKFLAKASEKVVDANGNTITVNPVIKAIIDNFSEATSRSSALAEAVKTQEGIITSGYTNPRLGVLKRASQYNKEAKKQGEAEKALESDREALRNRTITQQEFNNREASFSVGQLNRNEVVGRLKKAFDDDKKEHPSLSGLEIAEVAEQLNDPVQKAILDNEMKKQAASYNSGIEGQMKDMRENGTVPLLMEELKDEFEKFRTNAKDIASGQTEGISMAVMRSTDQITNPLKSWITNQRNVNYVPANKVAIDMLVKQGEQTLKYFKKVGTKSQEVRVNIDGAGGATKLSDFDFESLKPEEQRAVSTALNQSKLLSGSPAQHVANSADIAPESAV